MDILHAMGKAKLWELENLYRDYSLITDCERTNVVEGFK